MKKLILLSFVLLSLIVASVGSVMSQSRLINYQGNILDQDNKPYEGPVQMTFELYDKEFGGSQLWSEIQNVTMNKGYFNVYLGSTTPFPAGFSFDRELFVQVTVGKSAPYPRSPLTMVPAAFVSEVSALARFAEDIPDGLVTLNKLSDQVKIMGGDLTGELPNPRIRPGAILDNIPDGSITQSKLAPNVTTRPSGPASGDLTGFYPDPLIAPGAVNTFKLADDAVTTEKIADQAVTYNKFQNALGPVGTILGWDGTKWIETSVPDWELGRIIDIYAGDGMYVDTWESYYADDFFNVTVGIAEGGVTTSKIAEQAVTYNKLQNAYGPVGTILGWNGEAWIETDVPTWETDAVIGNEVLDATPDRGLVRAGMGTLESPYTLGIDEEGVVNSMIADQAVSLDKLLDGTTGGQVMYWNSVLGQWMLSAGPAPMDDYVIRWVDNGETREPIWTSDDAVVGNEVVDATEMGGLVRSGLGTEASPYTLGVEVGGITEEMLADGAVSLDKLTPGTQIGQIIWWDAVTNEWRYSTGDAPTQDYVIKWVDAGGTLTPQWAPDDMTIPYEKTITEHVQTLFSLTNNGNSDVMSLNTTGTGDGLVINMTEDLVGGGHALHLNGAGFEQPSLVVDRTTEYGLPEGAATINAIINTLDANSAGFQVNTTVNDDGNNAYDVEGIQSFLTVNNGLSNVFYTGTWSVANADNGITTGVWGDSYGMNAQSNFGVVGSAFNATEANIGVAGIANDANYEDYTTMFTGGFGAGVVALNEGGTMNDYGVFAMVSGNATGAYVQAEDAAAGVFINESDTEATVYAMNDANGDVVVGVANEGSAFVGVNESDLSTSMFMNFGAGSAVEATTGGSDMPTLLAQNYGDGPAAWLIGNNPQTDGFATNSSVAYVINTNNGRGLYVEGGAANDENAGNPFFQDPADQDDAALIVANTAYQGGAPWGTAIKTYGDIWANSTIGASQLVALDALVIGDPLGLNTTLYPPMAPGAPLVINTDVQILGDLYVEDIYADEVNANVLNAALGVFDNLQVNMNANVDGHTTLNTLATSGAATVGGTLGVAGVTTLNNNLIVNGTSTLNGAAQVNNTLNVTGNVVLNSAPGLQNTTVDNINALGALDVVGAITGHSTLGITGNVSLNTALGMQTTTMDNLVANGTATIAGATQINNTLGVTGLSTLSNTQINGTLGVTGATTLGNTLTVAGLTQINNNLNVTGNANVNGNGIFGGNVSAVNGIFSGNITAVNATLSGTLTVNGAYTRLSNTTALQVQGGDAGVGGDLLVSRGAGLSPEWTNSIPYLEVIDLDVLNNANIGNNLAVGNDTDIMGDLTVAGNAFLNANGPGFSTFVQELVVAEDAVVGNDLAVGNDGVFGNDLLVIGDGLYGGDLDVMGDLEVMTNTTLLGTLDVTGAATFANSVDNNGPYVAFSPGTEVLAWDPILMAGNFEGDAGDLFVSRGPGLSPEWTDEIPDLTISGLLTTLNLQVTNDAQIDNNLTVTNDVVVTNGDVDVQNGSLNVGMDVTVGNDLAVINDGIFGNDVIILGGNLEVIAGDANVAGDVNATNLNATNDVNAGNDVNAANDVNGTDLNASNDVNAANNVNATNVNATNNVTAQNNLVSINNTVVGNNLLVSNNATISGNATVQGDALINGVLTVDQNALFKQSVTINQDLTIDQNLTVTGTASFGNTVSISNADLNITNGGINVIGDDVFFGNPAGFDNPSAFEDLYVRGNIEADGMIFGAINPGLTPGSVTFGGPLGEIDEDNANLFYDDANNRLGIGTNAPTRTLDVNGTMNVSGASTLAAATLSGNLTANSRMIHGYATAANLAALVAAINNGTTVIQYETANALEANLVGALPAGTTGQIIYIINNTSIGSISVGTPINPRTIVQNQMVALIYNGSVWMPMAN